MAEKKWVVGLSAFLLAVLLFAGYMAMAAELGSRDDPLVTASYITEELMPNLTRKIDDAIAQKTKEYSESLDRQYDALAADLENVISDFSKSFSSGSLNDPAFIGAVADAVIARQGGGGGTAGTMKKVEVPSGKTVTLALGSEALLRIGSASCVASGAPGLIDMTAGSELSNGGALQKNHLYMCTVEGRGFKATAAVTVFIRGVYSIS